MRTSSVLLALALAAGPLHADTVKLSDGSSLSGQVTEQDNGDVTVVTGAGTMTVPAAKVARIVKDGDAATAEHHNAYVDKVMERRAYYGNEDGIPRTQNLQQNQVMVTIGQLTNSGDATLVADAAGTAVLKLSDISGISYGFAWSHSFSDYVALESWADYSAATKSYTLNGNSDTQTLQRYNLAIGPKVQKAINIGRPEQSLVLIPSIGITPLWSGANGNNKTTTFYSSSIGASLNAGLDFQFGGAVLSAKVRYLLTADVTGGLSSSNTSALLPQVGVGWSF